MNKLGLTMIELLAVIALLGVLVILVTPNIISIRSDILDRTYQSRINMINNAALDWANDNLIKVPSHVTNNHTCSGDCACITVGDLIEEGYLSGSDDKRTVMKNPKTNESLNNKNVCVRYNSNDVLSRKLISYIME